MTTLEKALLGVSTILLCGIMSVVSAVGYNSITTPTTNPAPTAARATPTFIYLPPTRVPTNTPTPVLISTPTPLPTSVYGGSLSAEDINVLLLLKAQIGEFTDAGTKLSALLKNPQLDNYQWKTDLARQMARIKLVHTNIGTVKSTLRTVNLSLALFAATDDCSVAMDELAYGLDYKSVSHLDSANKLITSCTEKFSVATALLKELLQQ